MHYPSLHESPHPVANTVFRNHLDNCNSSLVKLVTISQQISNLAESNKIFANLNVANNNTTTSENNTYNTVLNDSSLISESVDNFTGNEDYYDECCFTNASSRDEVILNTNSNNACIDDANVDTAELYANHKKLPSKPPLGFRDTINSKLNLNNNNTRKYSTTNNKKTTNCMINTTYNLDASSSYNYNNLDTTVASTNSNVISKNESSLNTYHNNNSANNNANLANCSGSGLITKFSIINVDKNEAGSHLKTFSNDTTATSTSSSFWSSSSNNNNAKCEQQSSRIHLLKQKLGVNTTTNANSTIVNA